MKTRHFIAGVALALTSAFAAHAVTPDEMLSDPALEARARDVSKELRCVVCQNQSIDDSNAPLAHDMRVLVRERILAGDSDERVKSYLVNRYGDFVLLKPRIKVDTLLLWFGPLLLLGAAAGGFALYFKGPRASARPIESGALSEDEEKRVAELRERLAP